MTEQKTRYTVIGAGHGGKAMAAHLGALGFPTTLYNRTPENVAAIKALGGINLEGDEVIDRHVFGALRRVTSDIAKAVADAEVIMVVVPASAHRDIANITAPHLRDDQIIILHPGRTGGALEFDRVLRDNECTADVTIAEAQTLIYACRSDGPAQSRIFRIKNAVPLAALPATRTARVLEKIRPAYPQFIEAPDVLHVSMNNIGAIFHPALTLLNAGRIESTGGNFQFYIDGVTPSVGRVLENLDRERVTVASALGIRAITAREWLQMAYDAQGENLHEAIHNNRGYYGINAPPTLNHRYITEDVPMSLVPISRTGQLYGVTTRAIDAIVQLACIVNRTDYWRRGRTPEKLGLGNFSIGELRAFVLEGILP